MEIAQWLQEEPQDWAQPRCESFTPWGAKVLIADLNQEAGEALKGELGERALFIETDVTQDASVKRAVEGAVNQHGGVHILVNCAGHCHRRKDPGPNRTPRFGAL